MYYQLNDCDNESMGIVKLSNGFEKFDYQKEICYAWDKFHNAMDFEEDEYDNSDIDDFVEWFNNQNVTQIERIYLTMINV